jgi:hypothetical protein
LVGSVAQRHRAHCNANLQPEAIREIMSMGALPVTFPMLAEALSTGLAVSAIILADARNGSERSLEASAVKQRDRPCAYCGTTEIERTKGHVIPKSLYPDSLPNAQRITVPECMDCKALWEDAEPQFRNTMVAIWDPETVVEDSRWRKMQRSMSKCDGPRRYRDFIDLLVAQNTPKGKRHAIYPAKDPQCNLILRRIVRGLCHHHGLGSAIADSRVWCDVMQFSVPEAFRSEITWHELSPGFCTYGYTVLGDERFHSFWLIRFSNHAKSFCGAIAAGEAGRLGEMRGFLKGIDTSVPRDGD